ncbi:MAG TPA: CHAT domain-containing protein, partial [Streptosporangiaceae bacterium]|nr:CHAT domain-containing protein [Streptosporangiaceae bacterium]
MRTEVIVEATVSPAGRLSSAVWVAGALAGRADEQVVPVEVSEVWSALDLPAAVASDRLADAGRRLGRVLFGDDAGVVVAGLIDGLRPDDEVEVVLRAAGEAVVLPVELTRLMMEAGTEVGPLGLLPGVSVSRTLADPDSIPGSAPPVRAASVPVALGGPVKILAAVAAPDETKTLSVPLDSEAEMQSVLSAVTPVAGGSGVEVNILEVASLDQLRTALGRDAYHVLHLSAHGSQDVIELEDEDGSPQLVTARELVGVLRHGGRPVPLIVLSSCAGAAGAQAMAAGLVRQGADRVIAMLAPVTDSYATMLAGQLYASLAAHPDQPAGKALAQARYQVERIRGLTAAARPVMPEFGLVTLLTARGDGPLTDSSAPVQPLTAPVVTPSGRSALDLPIGSLIGRRQQVRKVMGALRRTPAAVAQHGHARGVQLTGIGGIGKTAVAGRAITRLRAEGWLAAIHEGRWNPAALITAAAEAVSEVQPAGDTADLKDIADAKVLSDIARRLNDTDTDDVAGLNLITELLAGHRFIVVFDDFEQNLTPSGDGFIDPAFADVFATFTAAARKGGLLITSRYPLPGERANLIRVPIPPLSRAELGRMLLRMPALRDLDPEAGRLIARLIGGYPRLIELTDALLRNGHANVSHVHAKLRALAKQTGVGIEPGLTLGEAVNQAVILGSADILLSELTATLTKGQATILAQVAVSPEPVTVGDLRHALTAAVAGPGHGDREDERRPDMASAADLDADVRRLADLTLLTGGPSIGMSSWTADLVTRNLDPQELTARHAQALVMRRDRVQEGRGGYEDLVAIARHGAALGAYADVADFVTQAVQIMPGTLARLAYLADVQPLIPQSQPAWLNVADMQVLALMESGDLTGATLKARAFHQQLQELSAANPSDTSCQQGLAVSFTRLGDLAEAGGDVATARSHHQDALDISARLAGLAPSDAGR